MGEYGRPSTTMGGIGENQAQQHRAPSYLTASSAMARAEALLRPPRFGLPATGVSLAQSPQLDNQLAGQTVLVQSNNGMSRRLALPTPQRVGQAQRPRYHAVGRNGALPPSSSTRPRSTRYLTEYSYHAVRFLSGATFRFLNASPAPGAPGSIRSQSVVPISNVDSGHTGTVQRREVFSCCDALALFVRTRGVPGSEAIHRIGNSLLHEQRLPIGGTGPVGFGDGHLHGHSPLLPGTGSVPRSQPTGFRVGTPQMMESSGAGTARGGGDNRAATAARNEAILRRLNRMVRIGEHAARARADILAASRGRGGRGGGNQEAPDGCN